MSSFVIIKMDLPEDSETTLQISTPKGKKQRRISFNTGSKMERFSIIPKLDHSFSLHELDDDFEVKNLFIPLYQTCSRKVLSHTFDLKGGAKTATFGCGGVFTLAIKLDADCRSLFLYSFNFFQLFYCCCSSKHIEHLFTSKDQQNRIYSTAHR